MTVLGCAGMSPSICILSSTVVAWDGALEALGVPPSGSVSDMNPLKKFP